MASPSANIQSHSALETLPFVVLDVLLQQLAQFDRTGLLQLARVSPALYAPAISVAIHTASSQWSGISTRTRETSSQQSSMKTATTSHDTTPGRLGFEAETKTVFLITALIRDSVPARITVIGPIALHHLRAVSLSYETVTLITSIAFPLARDVRWSVQHPGRADTALSEIERIGGFPHSVATLDAYFRSKVAQGVTRFAERSIALITASRVKFLSIHFNDVFDLAPAMMRTLLASGLPQGLVSLSVSGLREIDEAFVVERAQTVKWPASLKYLALDIGYGDEIDSAYLGQILATIPGNLPALHSLEISGETLTLSGLSAQIVAALVPTLLSFHMLGLDDSVELQHLLPVVTTFATKGRQLQTLCFSFFGDAQRHGMLEFADLIVPLLRSLPLIELGLVGFGLGATEESISFLIELAAAVPMLKRLNLSKNKQLGLEVAEHTVQILPNLKYLELRSSLVKYSRDCAKLRAIKPSLTIIL